MKNPALLQKVRDLVRYSAELEGRRPEPEYNTLESFEILPVHEGGRIGKRAVLALRTKGCLWFRKPGIACTHCGLVADGGWDPNLSERATVKNFEWSLSRLRDPGIRTLCLYTPGSFLDDSELGPRARTQIAETIAASPYLERVQIETRPEFVTEEAIGSLVSSLGNVRLAIGLPIESLNSDIRSYCLNKTYSLAQYRKAVTTILKSGSGLQIYVLLKPPFLTEAMALQDSLETIRFAFELGADTVSLEPVSVQKGTLVHTLWRHGLYRPPWLWSILHCIADCRGLGRFIVGGIVVYPKSEAGPSNCESCSTTLREMIQEYNLHGWTPALASFRCRCRDQWQEELNRVQPELGEQVKRLTDEALRLGRKHQPVNSAN